MKIDNDKKAYLFLLIIIILKLLFSYYLVKYASIDYIGLFIIIGTFAFFLYLYTRNMYNRNKFAHIYRNNAILYLIFYYIFIYAIGLIVGFMKNPLSYSLLNILTNFVKYIFSVAIYEIIRYSLLKMNKSKLFCFLLTIILTLVYLNFNTILSLTSYVSIFKYVCKTIIPLLSTSIICTYIAKNGSLKGLLIFTLIPEIMAIYAPYQPDLNFYLTGLISIAFAFCYYVITKYQVDMKNPEYSKISLKKSNPLSYIPYLIVFGIVVSFVVGIFDYVPVAVMSNSMVPKYARGDIVIYKKIDNVNDLKKGNIICYKLNKIMVMHRIVNIEKQNNKLVFTTKGDNLKHNDLKKVTKEQIVGIIIKTIPKCGYPSVWFYELLNK